MRDDFCAFILTHGRADNVITHTSLEKCGYTGRSYFVIDDEDKQADKYYKNFGDQVLMFSKDEIEKQFDTFDNFGNRNTITHARNACFDLAQQVGVKYFIQLDDDYRVFNYKFDSNRVYIEKPIRSLDAVWTAMLEYYISTPLLTLAMGQGGDFVGGGLSTTGGIAIKTKRKAMNSFICSTERRFNFVGTMNEDVNTYVTGGLRGELFLSTLQVELKQKQTQSQSGGISELYANYGTYVKSFYTILTAPACVKISTIAGHDDGRIHHRIDFRRTVPKIIRESVKKHA